MADQIETTTPTRKTVDRVRNTRTGAIGTVIARHTVYPFNEDVTVELPNSKFRALWTNGTYEEIESE